MRMGDQFPKFDLEGLTPQYINAIVKMCSTPKILEQSISDVQEVLKLLEMPEYRKHNPEYTKEDIQKLIAKFTFIFRALLEKKAKK